MARRNQNLAGLAALGALGYALSRGKDLPPVEDRTGEDVVRPSEADADRMLSPIESSGTGEYAPAAPVVSGTRSMTPSAAPAMMSQEEMTRRRLAGGPRGRTGTTPARVAGQGGPRGVLYSPTDTGDETDRLAKRYPAPPKSDDFASPERRKNAGMLQSIKEYYQSPSSLEGVKRNAINTLNATAGLSAPGVVPQMTQRQFNARAAARRADEGLSDAEVTDLMRRRALSEMDTTGGAIGYKRGGKAKAKPAKKMASGGMAKSSASKRADGIATKGKTKCKMY